MTSFEIERLPFDEEAVAAWAPLSQRFTNWPVVYVLDNATKDSSASLRDVYVGESLNAVARMRQHLATPQKQHLKSIRVVVDETFNKSVCLDLESNLIRLLAGDGSYKVLNRNDGITESDYFDRAHYRETFDEIFEQLRSEGVFTRSIPEIENDDLFKLSPFKALTQDQAIAVEGIFEGLFEDLQSKTESTIVVQGDPGTGKTVVAIFMLKLLVDIATSVAADDQDNESLFSDFFVEENRDLLANFKVGIVVPQQSLRTSIEKVFKRTPGLDPKMVMTPFDVGAATEHFDLLIVDETHRLNQRANQPSGVQNTKFQEITTSLYGSDDLTKTQLDWLRARSTHQIFLLDAAQSVRPADVPIELLQELIDSSRREHRFYRLSTQMRVRAGSDYVSYVRKVLGHGGMDATTNPESFGDYDLRIFDDLTELRNEISRRDAEFGLSRLVAGIAWKWKSKKDRTAFDIEIDGEKLRWNSAEVDWIASARSIDEVGSIHTVQGYDLNYAGVIIGKDLRFDPEKQALFVDRKSYFDVKGKENNKKLGKIFTDEDLLTFITNIYAVLLTRGILGTYIYVCDPGLRSYLRKHLAVSPAAPEAPETP